jgi:hypothetical protein
VCRHRRQFWDFPLLVRIGTLNLLFSFTVPTIIVYVVLSIWCRHAPRALRDLAEEAFWTVYAEPAAMVSNSGARFRDMENRRLPRDFVTSREFRLDREIKDL